MGVSFIQMDLAEVRMTRDSIFGVYQDLKEKWVTEWEIITPDVVRLDHDV